VERIAVRLVGAADLGVEQCGHPYSSLLFAEGVLAHEWSIEHL
jgi:hypothetical protein